MRDRNGAEVLIIAVCATFDIQDDGTTRLASDQAPVALVPVYRGAPGKSSLLRETDLVLCKRTTDVLLHGHAYAPKGRAVDRAQVGMRVGPVKKALAVIGDRFWKGTGPWMRLGKPQPFVKIPIVYERAFGGRDEQSESPSRHAEERRNPIGTGFAAKKGRLSGSRAPNIEYPDRSEVPAGFGPIPGDWEPRSRLAGTYDASWRETRRPLLPSDFDERFFQCAPEDQQAPSYLEGGEPVVLVNLTPDGTMRFDLPKVRLVFETKFKRSGSIEHRPLLHTVILEPDTRRVQMVWHSRLECHARIYELESTVLYEKKYVRLSHPDRAAGGERFPDGKLP